MFQVEKTITKTYDKVIYKFTLSDEPFYDGYYNQRWEGSILEVTVDGKTYEAPFVLYSARGVRFTKVAKAISKIREAECVYFVDRIFGDTGLDIHNRFRIFHDGRKGLWRAYHKDNTKYIDGMNNADATRKFIAEFEARENEQKAKEQKALDEQMSKMVKTDTLVKLAKMTDEVTEVD